MSARDALAGPRLALPALVVLVAASTMLSLSLGVRQSLGILMSPATADLGIAVAEFTLAIAVQNLIWGLAQPMAGILAERHGFRAVMLGGAALYAAGLALTALAGGTLLIMLGAGVLIGLALAATASSIAMAVASRAVPAALRSATLGIVSAAGSIGAMIAAPLGQLLVQTYDWRVGALGFLVLALIMLPAAFAAGRVDRMPAPPRLTAADSQGDPWAVLRLALARPPFLIMSGAFFVCGLQLVFLTTHLPTYLEICGQDPMLSAQALGMVGGFNILGSLFFGWAGGHASKTLLLGVIYTARSAVLALYFIQAPTPENTLIFAALMGFLWLGVAPLLQGAVVEMFGLRWQAMLGGVAFLSHQLGSFLGAFGGGLLYDSLGNYDLAWQLGVAMGLVAGCVQMIAGLWPPGAGRDEPEAPAVLAVAR